tara:strand:- start:1073 stop:1288 length:216 start_codon:yes stop_codon:yes gene_type:complete
MKDNQIELQQELEEAFDKMNLIFEKIYKNLELMGEKLKLQETQIMCLEQIQQRMRPMTNEEAKEFLTKHKS